MAFPIKEFQRFRFQHFSFCFSDRIHKRLLHVREEHQAYGQNHKHDAEADAELQRVHSSRAQKGQAKSLDDGRQGVVLQHPAIVGRHGGHWQNNRGGIHQQLHAKRDEDVQIAIAGRERRDDDAAAESVAGQHQQKQRHAKYPAREMHVGSLEPVDGEEDQKNAELNGKGNEVGNGDGNGDDEPVEIDLAQQGRVAHERVGGFIYVIGEIAPGDGAGQIKQERRHAVGRQPGDLAEDDGEHDGGEQRLDDVPERAQNGLFVGGNEIPPDKQGNQVAIAPQLLQTPVKPSAMRSYSGRPAFVYIQRTVVGGQRSEVRHTLIKAKSETLKAESENSFMFSPFLFSAVPSNARLT